MDIEFQELISRFKDFPIIERKPSFLDIAQCPHRENVWRNIFAFYLNPKECHGFKDLFLRSLFDSIKMVNQGTGDFDSMVIKTECGTRIGNRLDLMIQCNEFVIGIEMKVNAPLTNDLDDYAKLIHHATPKAKYKIVLSKNSCQPSSGFVNLLYSQLILVIKSKLGDYVLSADPKYTAFLLDFLNHITYQTGEYAMNVDIKQVRFLHDNYTTVQQLLEAHYKTNEMLVDKLAKIYEAINANESLKQFIVKPFPPFNYEGYRLSKFCLKSNNVQFYCELSVTKDYGNDVHYYIDTDQHEYEHLNDVLNSSDCKFDFSQDVADIAAVIAKAIPAIVECLSKVQQQGPSPIPRDK